MKTKTTIVTLIAALGTACSASAAVSLLVTRPPVVGPPNTGPLHDPDAVQGQWFENEGARSHEFYDNVPGFGGGSSASRAIEGYATNVVYANGPGTAIVSFSVMATVTNDLGTESGSWANGANSHGEGLSTQQNYVGEMLRTMMTIEFALADPSLQPPVWGLPTPYTQWLPEIYATNEHDLAWYCYNSNEQDPLGHGNYYVPAWDFGDIPLGQSSTLQLDFAVNGTLPTSDPRYLAIEDSAVGNLDILSNRTTSLKISDWVDTIMIDPGGAYDPETESHSNASVFHLVPEPSVVALLGLAGLLALRRRR